MAVGEQIDFDSVAQSLPAHFFQCVFAERQIISGRNSKKCQGLDKKS
jgi:hypothetical protein